jgi:hypothetical protein
MSRMGKRRDKAARAKDIGSGENDSPSLRRRPLATSALELTNERHGNLPIWIRAPARGPEYYTGFTRPKLYELAGKGRIRSVAIREPGRIRGCRLFHLQSILDFIDKQAKEGNV